jgi:hypothetical protein
VNTVISLRVQLKAWNFLAFVPQFAFVLYRRLLFYFLHYFVVYCIMNLYDFGYLILMIINEWN